MAAYDKLEGDLVTLKRIGEKGFDALFQRFQEPRYFAATGLRKPPSRQDLHDDVFGEDLLVWEVFPEGADAAVGYMLIVGYDGPPYIEVVYFDGGTNLDMSRDAMLLGVHAYFQHTEEDELHIFVPQPVSEEVHELLTESGFDAVDEHPTVSLAEEAAYVMLRETYRAYYGDDEDDEAEELDFG